MAYSFTGIAYLTLLIPTTYLIFRLYTHYQKERMTIPRLFLYFILPFWFLIIIKAIGGLFFADNRHILEFTIDMAAFLETIGLAVGAYLFLYIKYPKISPWLGFSIIFILGTISTIMTIQPSFNPHLEASGAINWNIEISSSSMLVLRTFIFFLVAIPFIILYNNQRKSSDSYVRSMVFKIMLFFILMLIIIIIDFLANKILKLDPIWRDYSLIIASIFLLSIFYKSKD